MIRYSASMFEALDCSQADAFVPDAVAASVALFDDLDGFVLSSHADAVIPGVVFLDESTIFERFFLI